MPRPQSWTDQELIDAVETSTTFFQVCRLLGLHPGGGTYLSLERHMTRLGLDISHLARRKGRLSRRAWTDDDLRAAVQASRSLSEVARRLGYKVSGGMHRFLKHHLVRLGVDTSHLTGQSWARGHSFPGRRARPLADILVERSTYLSTKDLRKRLIAAGLKRAECEECGLTEWCGRKLPLELDHINGDHTDNRLENLRILCPNCHAVTETWCKGRKPA